VFGRWAVDALRSTANWAPLIDVSGLLTADLVASDSPVLDRCIKRLVRSLDDPDGVISAFQSYVE
jgi:hypothetical protein